MPRGAALGPECLSPGAGSRSPLIEGGADRAKFAPAPFTCRRVATQPAALSWHGGLECLRRGFPEVSTRRRRTGESPTPCRPRPAILRGMTEPQPTKLFSTGLIYACLAWTPIPLAIAMVWDATRKGTGLWQVSLDELVWGILIGFVGVLMAVFGLGIAHGDSDRRDREAPGHPYAVFGVWSNAAALIAATVAYRVLLG